MATTSTLVFANNAGSTLAGSISNTALSLNLQAGGGALFPNPTTGQIFVITAVDAATGLLREIMWCTARSADTLTVVRAQEGTTALAWNAGDLIQELWTAGQAAQMLQIGQGGTVYVPVVPATVWYVDGALGTNALGQGLTSGSGAFATPAYAESTIGKYFSAGQVTVNVAAWGTKYAGFTIGPSLISSWNWVGAGTATTTIAATTGAVNSGIAFGASQSVATVTGFTLEALGYNIASLNSSTVNYTTIKIVGDGTSCFGLYAAGGSLFNNNGATVTYSGTFGSVITAIGGGQNEVGFSVLGNNRSVTLTNSSATVNTGTALANSGGTVFFISSQVAFAGGNPTGPRFNSTGTGLINTGGSGATYIPGTTAGTAQNTFNYA